MEMNNKVTRHKYGHRGLNEFNSVNESVAKREFYNNRLKKEQEAILEAQTIKEAESSKQATLLENINNRKINEIKMHKSKNLLHEVITDKLFKVAMCEAFKESLYLDESYKIDNSEKLESVVETFINNNNGHKLLENAIKQNKDSLFLKSIYEACNSRAKKIVNSRCKEADNNPEKIDFDVRLDELEEFKEDLSKTNIDTLGKIVKDKVLNTVIDEKERSIKKQEFEEDIKNEVEGAVTESLKYKIHNKNITEQPSLFSAMMRKNYSEMLQESVSVIQTYNPNDKLSEIGLDETEVDYNDKNEHSLTGIDTEKIISTRSMKPEDHSDNYSGGNSSFDNSALATLDDESDDIDMFTLTNESVTQANINELDDETKSSSEDKPTINVWSKFVNTNTDDNSGNKVEKEEDEVDNIENNDSTDNNDNDEQSENLVESVLDEYESVLESDEDLDNLYVMESAVDSIEFDEDGVLYEELLISDDFIKSSVEKMSDKDLQKHLPKLEKMIVDLGEELKIAKSGQIPALANSAVGPIRKFFVKLNVKLNGLTPEKAANNIQELIAIGKKEISFVKAELKKRGLKAVSESFTSVLDEYDYLTESTSIDEGVSHVDKESPEYIAIESIAKLGNDNKLRIDQRRRVVRICESLSIGQIADLTAKYRNEAVYLNENITKLSNMNDMDKAVYVYEASIGKEGYNFNEELSELKKKIDICNEQVGLFNIAAKILITLESLGLSDVCKEGRPNTVCIECGADLIQGSNCLDCGTSISDLLNNEACKESTETIEESTKVPTAEVFMDKVLCESLIEYTLLEMMHTAKIINYTNNDVKKLALEMNK